MIVSKPWVVKKQFYADKDDRNLFYDVNDTSKVYTKNDINQLVYRYQALTCNTHYVMPAMNGGLQIVALE